VNDHQIAARIVYCMAASAIAAALIVVAILSGNREWAAVSLLPALTSLAAIGPVLRDIRRQR